MQGRAWYEVGAGWLLTIAGILGSVYGLFGLVVTLWAARIGYHTPGFSLVHSAIRFGASFAIAAAALWGARQLRRGAAESRRST
jgi:formate hydrogenlyase subunit 3/multisubunit Na+/H+ antiporter MnhD subunit